MRTNLNSTSMRNTCPEFPLFGANYPDATCIDGILYDLDNVGDDGVLITIHSIKSIAWIVKRI